jgi:TolA-binding protein
MDSIISRQDQTEERILQMEFKIEKLLHENKYKEKIITHKYNIKEL